MDLFVPGLAVHELVSPSGAWDEVDVVVLRFQVAFITYLRLGFDPSLRIVAFGGFENDELLGSLGFFRQW